jgi:serine/threonine protein kinase
MSPEQASGRVEHMDERTDIYGLGAILFEILTGQPPHRVQKDADPASSSTRVDGPPPQSPIAALLHRIATGESPQVRSIDATIPDELDAICGMAMAKHRDDRYQTAKGLKAALLEFQVHEESIELAARADDDLDAARQSGNYDDFSRARFGFETALEQWPENVRAAEGLRAARIDYGRAAFDRGDFDLALSLLDTADSDHSSLMSTIQAAAKERASRARRIHRLHRFGVAATQMIALLAVFAAVWIGSELHKPETNHNTHLYKMLQLLNFVFLGVGMVSLLAFVAAFIFAGVRASRLR